MSDFSRDDIAHELYLLVQAKLLDVKMREDGQWVYLPTEYSKSLTPEELQNIIDNIEDYIPKDQ